MYYTQNENKIIEIDSRFKHVMALSLNPQNGYKDGLIRCITSRTGDLQTKGYIDRSKLLKVSGNSLYDFKIDKSLEIKDPNKIIDGLAEDGFDLIGFEDPDIWFDKENNLIHVYFTIPFIAKNKKNRDKIHLGHAVGLNLNSLVMTKPVLIDQGGMRAKEVSIAPVNKDGIRLNLIESEDRRNDISYSVVRIAKAKDMGADWSFGDIVFHPNDQDIPWIAGHASPGPLFSKDFIDAGEGKMLGIINGREANEKRDDGSTKYGTFSIGLFIYDYENGKVDWVSPEPFIRDNEASTITFASQFIEIGDGVGILYAHVDDSFVRSYTLKREKVESFIKLFKSI